VKHVFFLPFLSPSPIQMVFLISNECQFKSFCTGASRGFAFVEFQSIADAQRWMDQNQVENLALS
jgi:RNA recognition motif-containing protein